MRVRSVVLLAVFALALSHGFAGAATHLPHHPGSALMAGTGSTPQADGTEEHHDGHGGSGCEMVTGSGGPQLHPGADGPATSCTTTLRAVLSSGAALRARAPPKPSLAALSVLRI